MSARIAASKGAAKAEATQLYKASASGAYAWRGGHGRAEFGVHTLDETTLDGGRSRAGQRSAAEPTTEFIVGDGSIGRAGGKKPAFGVAEGHYTTQDPRPTRVVRSAVKAAITGTRRRFVREMGAAAAARDDSRRGPPASPSPRPPRGQRVFNALRGPTRPGLRSRAPPGGRPTSPGRPRRVVARSLLRRGGFRRGRRGGGGGGRRKGGRDHGDSVKGRGDAPRGCRVRSPGAARNARSRRARRRG